MANFEDLKSVVDNPLAFSEKLGIDADTFAALVLKKNLREVLLDCIDGTAEEFAHAVEDGFRESTGEEITSETGTEISAEVGTEIGSAVVREIATKFGKEVASEIGVDIATEFAAQIGAEIAGEAGAESARAGAVQGSQAGLARRFGVKKGVKKVAANFGGVADEVGYTAGVAVATSPLVAGTFFPAKGILGILGITTAATPVGWVTASAIGGGLLASWGFERLFAREEDDEIEVTPNCIKTPLDVLAFRLFYFFAPLGLKVALADSTFAKVERRFIHEYFQNDWGYSKEFIQDALIEIKGNIDQYDIVELTKSLIEFGKDNPTGDYGNIPKELRNFLHAVMHSDGNIDQQELDVVNAIIAEKESQFRDFWNDFLNYKL